MGTLARNGSVPLLLTLSMPCVCGSCVRVFVLRLSLIIPLSKGVGRGV